MPMVYGFSLLRALMNSEKKTRSTTSEEVTDGIDIKTWSIKHKEGVTVTYSAWDFAGQSVYYNTHQVATFNTILPSTYKIGPLNNTSF